MNSLPPVYNNSLRFNQFDLRVITCGVFNKLKFFVAGIRNAFLYNKDKITLTVVELILIHSVYKDNGIFVKRHLQSYNNLHFLLLSNNVAKKVTNRWNKSYQKSEFVIAFVKHKSCRTKHVRGDKFYFCETLIPGDTIVLSDNVSPLYFKGPNNRMQFNMNNIPLSFIQELQCSRVIEVDRCLWKTAPFKLPYSKRVVTKQENNQKKEIISPQKSETVPVTVIVDSQSATTSFNVVQGMDFPLEIMDDLPEDCMESVMIDSYVPLPQLHSRGLLYDEDFLLYWACKRGF